MSEMQGGNFRSGFLSGGFTQAFAPTLDGIDSATIGPSLERTIAAAVVGGTGSVIGGGKFANGAITGAFSRLFNDDLAKPPFPGAVQTKDPITGKWIWVHRDYIAKVVTYSPTPTLKETGQVISSIGQATTFAGIVTADPLALAVGGGMSLTGSAIQLYDTPSPTTVLDTGLTLSTELIGPKRFGGAVGIGADVVKQIVPSSSRDSTINFSDINAP